MNDLMNLIAYFYFATLFLVEMCSRSTPLEISRIDLSVSACLHGH